MEKWQIVQSIYQKVIAKCPVDTLNTKKVKAPNSTHALRLLITRGTTQDGDTHDPNGTKLYKIVSPHYKTACMQTLCSSVSFLNFNSENERKNAWQSYLTKFARFCIAMDESTKLAPYMDDYTQPWTDEMFKEYFELTDEEWKVIDETIK